MKKKLISFALTLAMVMALTVPAFAAATDPFVDGIHYTSSNECVGAQGGQWENPLYQYPLGTVLTASNNCTWCDASYNALGSKDLVINSTEVQTFCLLCNFCANTHEIRFQGIATDGTPTTPAEPEKPADEKTIGSGEFKVTFSAVEAWETVKKGEDDVPFITAKVGTVIDTPKNIILYTATNEDGVYSFSPDDMFEFGGEPFTLTESQIGLWGDMGAVSGHPFFLKVVAGDSSTTTPTKPEQPETPTEPTQPTEPETPTQPTTPVIPDAPGTYTVKKGDTWSSICTNFYGTNAQRYALQKANKGVALKEGAVITLPEKLGKDTLIPAPAAAAGEKLYTVKAGDTLGRIAAAEYGKVSEYKAIFERNADRLKNANLIYEGQVIVLPAKK